MMEQPQASEGHYHVIFIAAVYYQVVPYGAAGLGDIADAGKVRLNLVLYEHRHIDWQSYNSVFSHSDVPVNKLISLRYIFVVLHQPVKGIGP